MTQASSFLREIEGLTQKRVEERRKIVPLSSLEAFVTVSREARFQTMLSLTGGPKIIAEIKKRSPSQGPLKASVNPADLAREYVSSGASALSILTEPQYFGGDLADLSEVRRVLPEFPLLQKDFIIDPYQIFEARSLGADAVLLIMALLGEEKCARFLALAHELGMAALIEVHNEEELRGALKIGAKIVGVNNRDLHTLKISLDVSRRLASLLPPEVYAVSESGISEKSEVQELSRLGFRAFLIGSSFMKTDSPGETLRTMLREDSRED